MSTYYEMRIDVVLDLSEDKELLNYIEESKRYIEYLERDEKPFNFKFNDMYNNYVNEHDIDTLHNQFTSDKRADEFILDKSDLSKVILKCYTGNKNRDGNLERIAILLFKVSVTKPVIILYNGTNYWLKNKYNNDDYDYYSNWDIIENIYVPYDDKYNGFYDDRLYVLDNLFNDYEFHESDIEVYKQVKILEETK